MVWAETPCMALPKTLTSMAKLNFGKVNDFYFSNKVSMHSSRLCSQYLGSML